MKNAHLRFGTMGFQKSAGNTLSRFTLRMDRFIGERSADGVSKGHFISVIGGDAQIAAASAIISELQSFTVEALELPSMQVQVGKDAQMYRASMQLPGYKRPVRHLVAISQEFGTAGNADTSGRTLLADGHPSFVWTSLAQILGLPAVPEWAEWFYGKLEDHLAISAIHGLGLRPVAITGTKKEFLSWLSEGIRRREIQFPERNGPTVWPPMNPESILLSADAEPTGSASTTLPQS